MEKSCKICSGYEKATKKDRRESCRRLLNFLADITGQTRGYIILIDSKEIKACPVWEKRG